MVSVTSQSTTIIFQLNKIFNLKNNDSVPLYTKSKSIDESSGVYLIYFTVSGLETTKPQLGFCSIAEAHGYPSRRLEVYQKLFSEVMKKWMETKQFRISE